MKKITTKKERYPNTDKKVVIEYTKKELEEQK